MGQCMRSKSLQRFQECCPPEQLSSSYQYYKETCCIIIERNADPGYFSACCTFLAKCTPQNRLLELSFISVPIKAHFLQNARSAFRYLSATQDKIEPCFPQEHTAQNSLSVHILKIAFAEFSQNVLVPCKVP